MVLAGIAAYFSVRYLMRYFESGRLYPFAYYCVSAGILFFAIAVVAALFALVNRPMRSLV